MENTFITALEDMFNYKFTENGAIALKSTGSKVYDLLLLVLHTALVQMKIVFFCLKTHMRKTLLSL